VSNRGHDNLAVFAIDPVSRNLTLTEHVLTGGRTPQYFTFDPSGSYLFAANQNSNTVVLFRVDAATG
jgi:6-phosphogluconolactonase